MKYSGSSRVITTTRRNKVAEVCSSGKLDLVHKLECPRHRAATAERETVEMQREIADPPTSLSVPGAWEDCTLYLSTLPDHHELERGSLVGKWLAGELVAEKEVAESYFDELVNRNVLLQHSHGEHRYRFGEEPTYYVHPTILGILRKMSEEKGFVTFIPPASSSDPPPERRPCVHLVVSTAAVVDVRSATSVTVHGNVNGVIPPWRHLEHKAVLVLDLEGCQDVKDWDVVDICCHLTLLRYLSIRGTPVTVIPRDVRNLTDLETLDVRKTRLQWLPMEVARLPKLERLLFSEGVTFIGQGAMETSYCYPSSSSSIKVLGAVDQRDLAMLGLAYAKDVRDLVVVCNAEDLPDQWPASSTSAPLEKLKVVGRCVMLPAWIKEKQLSKVTVLDIRMCQIKAGDLEALGRMASLQSLALSLVSLPTKQIAIHSNSHDGDKEPLFQRLEVFALDCRVPWVSFHDKAMPVLRSLYLKLYDTAGGDNLKTPSGTTHLAGLREVTLQFSPRYAGSAAVAHTVAAMEKQLAHHTGNMPVTLFIDKELRIPQMQARAADASTLFPNWCLRNFLECVVMPTVYLFRWCYKRWGDSVDFIFYMLAILLFFLLLPSFLSNCLLPNITNMVARKIAQRAFASPAIVLPLPLVFYALHGKSKWLPVLHFSIFILLDAYSYQPFTRAFLKLLPLFLTFRYFYVQTGTFNPKLLVMIPIFTLLFCNQHVYLQNQYM